MFSRSMPENAESNSRHPLRTAEYSDKQHVRLRPRPIQSAARSAASCRPTIVRAHCRPRAAPRPASQPGCPRAPGRSSPRPVPPPAPAAWRPLLAAACCAANPGSYAGAAGSRIPLRRPAAPGDQGPQQARDVFAPFRISAQPEQIVRHPARQIRRPRRSSHRLVPRPQHAERIHRTVPQHPGVFAMAAALHGDHRTIRARHTHQSARHRDPAVAGIQHIRRSTRLRENKMPVVPHRRRGKRTCSCATYS